MNPSSVESVQAPQVVVVVLAVVVVVGVVVVVVGQQGGKELHVTGHKSDTACVGHEAESSEQLNPSSVESVQGPQVVAVVLSVVVVVVRSVVVVVVVVAVVVVIVVVVVVGQQGGIELHVIGHKSDID